MFARLDSHVAEVGPRSEASNNRRGCTRKHPSGRPLRSAARHGASVGFSRLSLSGQAPKRAAAARRVQIPRGRYRVAGHVSRGVAGPGRRGCSAVLQRTVAAGLLPRTQMKTWVSLAWASASSPPREGGYFHHRPPPSPPLPHPPTPPLPPPFGNMART